MSLYYEGTAFLLRANEQTSLKSLVFGEKGLKSTPTQLYALLVESVKWSSVLSSVIEKSALLSSEKKLTPALALLLIHDLLLSKNGIAAPKNHGLRQAIERHKSRLTAEFTRARIRAAHATVASWRASLEASATNGTQDGDKQWIHPRWIRINSLKATLDSQLKDTFADYELVRSLNKVLGTYSQKIIYRDQHIRDLVAVPHGIDLSKSPAYLNGYIIFQDKASCFPATLLDLQRADGDIIDACAAPGNKTTHTAALYSDISRQSNATKQAKIFACEREKGRAAILQKMVNKAVGSSQQTPDIQCLAGQDFLKLNPQDPRFSKVGVILLDPSCSGSGIVGRDATALVPGYDLVLPRRPNELKGDNSRGRKDKKSTSQSKVEAIETKNRQAFTTDNENELEQEHQPDEQYAQRLEALSNFQTSMIEHAFRFPSAHKIAYSTCSLHAEENEHVVIRALLSLSARERGWRVCTRAEQVPPLQKWEKRGLASEIESFLSKHQHEEDDKCDPKVVAEACLRCEKGTEDGTMGFFAVMFVRDKGQVYVKDSNNVSSGVQSAEEPDYEEWVGFSDDEDKNND